MIEDDLRAAMRAHESEAPGVDSFVARPLRRRAAGPILAAVAVTAVVVAVVTLGWSRPAHHGQTAGRTPQGSTSAAATQPPVPAALRCPEAPAGSDDPNGWVPAQPQTQAPDRVLVPHILPQAVVVCSYTGHYPTTGPHADTLLHPRLAGERAVGGNLLSVTETLSQVPKGRPGACADYLAMPADSEYYLIGVLIDGNRTWVAAPGNHCQGTTNGVFNGRSNLRLDAQQAYDWGRWDSDPTLRPQCRVPEAAVGPTKLRADPNRLTVCIHTLRSWVVLRTATPGNSAINTYNAALATRSRRCGLASRVPFDFVARLDYADGTSLFIGGDTTCIGGPDGTVLAGHQVSRVVDAFTQEPFGIH